MSKSDHIFVVDDNSEIRQLLSYYLQSSNYRVWTAADGKEMRQVLATVQIDLIVLDVLMPDENVLALYRELRVRHETPVIMRDCTRFDGGLYRRSRGRCGRLHTQALRPARIGGAHQPALKRARSYPFQSS